MAENLKRKRRGLLNSDILPCIPVNLGSLRGTYAEAAGGGMDHLRP